MSTLLDVLERALSAAGGHHQDDAVAPACVLWLDPSGEWAPALPLLRGQRDVLSLGAFDPETRRGPAIWIRSVVDTGAPRPPVVYVPSVTRDVLRSEAVPDALRPLVDLQFRGVPFLAPRQRPWTVAAFLKAQGVDVSDSAKGAVAGHLDTLLQMTVEELRARSPLTVGTLGRLAFPDLPGLLLGWLSSGEAVSDALQEAFQAEYGVDVRAGQPEVARALVIRTGPLAGVWERFASNPAAFAGVRGSLEAAAPAQVTWTPGQVPQWPQVNRAAETALREGLAALVDVPAGEARAGVRNLEAAHAARRGSVWEQWGEAPLVQALAPLAALAEATAVSAPGSTPAELADWYAREGHRADLVALQALGAVEGAADSTVVAGVVRALTLEWLTRVNERFATLVLTGAPLPGPVSGTWTATPGLAVVFVDGLRFDTATLLSDLLAAHDPQVTWQFAALPTITPTAKPAVSPAAGELTAHLDGGLALAHGKRTVNAAVLRDALGQIGFLSAPGGGLPDPASAAWLETGNLDSLGHSQGLHLARLLPGELRRIADRVQQLLAAGFREVRVITDHGWLLMPGGLPKADLPAALAAFKKGRCALLKPGNASEYPAVSWAWNLDVQVTLAPGIHSFEAGEVYAHGGLSLQETVIPVLTVRGGAAPQAVSIDQVRWVGNRCRLQLSGAQDCLVDLRTRAADPASSLLTAPRPVGADGTASVLVAGDDLDGLAATLVVLRGDQIVREQPLKIGDNA